MKYMKKVPQLFGVEYPFRTVAVINFSVVNNICQKYSFYFYISGSQTLPIPEFRPNKPDKNRIKLCDFGKFIPWILFYSLPNINLI